MSLIAAISNIGGSSSTKSFSKSNSSFSNTNSGAAVAGNGLNQTSSLINLDILANILGIIGIKVGAKVL